MAYDPKLASEEARRTSQHEAIKSQLRSEVNEEIVEEAQAPTPHERAEAHDVGREMRERAVKEVKQTEREVRRGRGLARVAQVIDYLFFVLYGLIGLEIVLEATGARESNAFKEIVDAITAPFLAPFRTLFPSLGVGPFRFFFSYLAALVVYVLAHLAIRALLRVIAQRKNAV